MNQLPKATFATYVGLVCALGVPLLIVLLRLRQGTPHPMIVTWQGEAILWGLAAAVLCILLFWEQLPLTTIGLGRPRWSSLAWGIAGAVAVRIVAAVTILIYASVSGISLTHAFGSDLATAVRLGSLPLGVVFLLAVRAGVTEEILFRGYGIERLAAVTGNRYFAAAVSLVIFTVAHLGGWDLNYLIVVFPIGLVLTIQYLWRRDLWANIFAHFLTDAMGLMGAYAIAHHLVQVKNVPGLQ